MCMHICTGYQCLDCVFLLCTARGAGLTWLFSSSVKQYFRTSLLISTTTATCCAILHILTTSWREWCEWSKILPPQHQHVAKTQIVRHPIGSSTSVTNNLWNSR